MMDGREMAPPAAARPQAYPSFADALRVWARVALLSFGGPAGQIAVMHRILVEEKRWLGERRFLHALNFCMLLPGPEAQQLAIYIGWLLHRTRGGIAAGLLFVLPGLLAIMVLSWVYALYGRVGTVEGLFFGLKAAVLAIVLQAVVRIGGRALRNATMLSVAAVSFLAIFAFGVPFPVIVLGAGLLGYAMARAGSTAFAAGGGHAASGAKAVEDSETLLGEGLPAHVATAARNSWKVGLAFLALWLLPTAALLLALGPESVFSKIAIFFSQMAVVTFGGAYAVLAYVAQEAVGGFGWLTPEEMLDGLGLAETTPGPLIMVTQFVGFLGALREAGELNPLLAATLGGLLTTWVTFTPCFLWIFLGAPHIERLRANRALSAALAAITAAVVGVVLNLAIWFALHFLFAEVTRLEELGLSLELPVLRSLDPVAALLSLAALIAVFRLRFGVIRVLLACAAAGLVLHLAGLGPAGG